MTAAVDLDRDETTEGFLRRISGAKPDPLEALRLALAEAKVNVTYYANLSSETRDMAAERETPQGRDATMSHAMRLKGQQLVWERRVAELTAEIGAAEAHAKSAPVQAAPVVLARDSVEGMDDMARAAA